MSENPYESPKGGGPQPAPVSTWHSLGLTFALGNLGVWEIGVLLNFFGGTIDQLGAVLCRMAFALAPVLILVTVVDALISRAASPSRSWNLYGPSAAIVAFLVISWQTAISARY